MQRTAALFLLLLVSLSSGCAAWQQCEKSISISFGVDMPVEIDHHTGKGTGKVEIRVVKPADGRKPKPRTSTAADDEKKKDNDKDAP